MATQIPLVKLERDPTYRLPDAERQRIRRRFDLDALERLLAHVAPEHREELQECFRIPDGNEVRELWHVGDPELQEMLEEVWAPTWDRVPLEAIEADRTPRPGKRLALARRKSQPQPHEVVLWTLGAVDAGQWDEAGRWVASGTVAVPALDVLRANGAAGGATRTRSIVGVVPEGDDTAHVLYREQGAGAGVVRVQTVRRTPDGWRVRLDELIAQVGQASTG
jgi:hypothetical protein